MKKTSYLSLCAAVATLTIAPGCTSRPKSALFMPYSTVLDASQPRITGSHRRIVRGEMQSPHINNAWEAIRRLRPDFLATRLIASPNGHTSATPIVYLDGVRQGGLEALYSIPIDVIIDIRYVNARGMREWLGPNHASDAIVVRTRP